MSEIEGQGGKIDGRAGTHALTLLSVPLNLHALEALSEEPRSLVDLRRAMGSPPPTTMRSHVKALAESGIVDRRREATFPSSVDFALTDAGRDLLNVVKILQAWLLDAPDGSLLLGSIGARSAIKALVDGWSAAIVRALAAKPLALTELSRLITDTSYPALERRLSAMRLAGQIEPCVGRRRSRPYRVTDWLRRAIAPLAAAAGWERRFAPGRAAPIGRLDIEAAFLLAVPLLTLPAELSGRCRLAVDVLRNGEHGLAGVLIDVQGGEVVRCTSRLQGEFDAVATGSAAAWLRAIAERDTAELELGGDGELAAEFVTSLNGALSGVPQRP